jgi:hypothetical protein
MRRAYSRAKFSGRVTVWQADELAHFLLGLHPCEVWGNWFDISPGMSHGSTPCDPQDEGASMGLSA